MKERRLGVIMNGVTGRMGRNQHLVRSVLAIGKEGGVELADGSHLALEPLLVGRNEKKLRSLADEHGLHRWTTSLEEALSSEDDRLFFDAGPTSLRAETLSRAIAAGKDIYCEKPVAGSLDDALDLLRKARAAGIRHGVVQDKLWLPGVIKLRRLIDAGFFGRVLSVRGEFGYWVFEGELQSAQRPSWNYRAEDGGGIILDMVPHWRYLLDHLFGGVESICCLGATHLPERRDEEGRRYTATADDAAYLTMSLPGGAVASFNSSWSVRVRRDDLLTIQVDGTHGSALAGLRRCFVQPRGATPRPVWNPDSPQKLDFFAGWQEIADDGEHENAFKVQWELFIEHLFAAADAEFTWDLAAGARGVQLAELALRSWRERRWLDVPELEV